MKNEDPQRAERLKWLRCIFDRVKYAEGIQTDKGLAAPLSMSVNNLAIQKQRATIPVRRLIDYAERRQISLEWLLHGRGPMKRVDIVGPGAVYSVETNQDAVYAIAAQVYGEVCAHDNMANPEAFERLVKLLHRGMLETGREPSPEKITEMVLLAC